MGQIHNLFNKSSRSLLGQITISSFFQIVTEELEALNRRFAQLSSLILEKRNVMQVLIQNWKREKQVR